MCGSSVAGVAVWQVWQVWQLCQVAGVAMWQWLCTISHDSLQYYT
jgi:hypothetical protein